MSALDKVSPEEWDKLRFYGEMKGPDVKRESVNSPAHYNKGGVECIEAIEASMTHEAFAGYLKGNVLKYLWRYESKVAPIEDLRKAKWYLERLIKQEM